MQLNYLIASITSQNLVTTFTLSSILIIPLSLYEIYIRLTPPATRSKPQKVNRSLSKEFSICHIIKTAERAINDNHINVFRKITCWNTTKTPSIYTNFTSYAYFRTQVLQQGFWVKSKFLWWWSVLIVKPARAGFSESVASVVPYKDVETFLKEKSKVKSMREVYHMLVEHRVRITKNKCIAVFVLRYFIWVINLLASSCKEHRVYHDILTLYESLLAVECFRQNLSHLLRLSKDDSRTAPTVSPFIFPSATCFQRFNTFLTHFQKFFNHTLDVLDAIPVYSGYYWPVVLPLVRWVEKVL